MFYKKYGKPVLDKVLALLGCIVLSPVLIGVSLWIKATSQGPILFRQRRIGIGKTTFEILKFRTMLVHAPQNCPTHLLAAPEQYMTRPGKFLRKTSLDELPQLFNILKGEMSIVGPRPALWNQYDLLEQRDRYGANDITPGLTGWAQINGRDELPIPIKAKFDGEYAAQIGFKLDCEIFLRTMMSVIKREGIQEGQVGKTRAKS